MFLFLFLSIVFFVCANLAFDHSKALYSKAWRSRGGILKLCKRTSNEGYNWGVAGILGLVMGFGCLFGVWVEWMEAKYQARLEREKQDPPAKWN